MSNKTRKSVRDKELFVLSHPHEKKALIISHLIPLSEISFDKIHFMYRNQIKIVIFSGTFRFQMYFVRKKIGTLLRS